MTPAPSKADAAYPTGQTRGRETVYEPSDGAEACKTPETGTAVKRDMAGDHSPAPETPSERQAQIMTATDGESVGQNV